jgi:hypothetical protein
LINPTYDKMASALQAQVDATVRTMRETINNIPERKERLDSFENRTDGLSITSHGSCNEANEVRKRVCWKDVKGRMCLISSVIILLVVIVVLPVVALMLQHHN